MNTKTRIFIVDDDEAVRDALALLLKTAGHAVVTFAGAAEFLDAYTPYLHGCIILDMNMPGMDGSALHDELRRRGTQLPVIFLTGYGSIPTTVRALKNGAVNFLTKPVNGAELLACVKEALTQHAFVRRKDDILKLYSLRLDTLTEREREIMTLVIEGFTSKEIAQRINISYRTVEIHRAHVMQKTGASNLLELAQIAAMSESAPKQ